MTKRVFDWLLRTPTRATIAKKKNRPSWSSCLHEASFALTLRDSAQLEKITTVIYRFGCFICRADFWSHLSLDCVF